MDVAAAVRSLAEEPSANVHIGSHVERILTSRYCLFFGPAPHVTMAQRLRMRDEEVEAVVEEVRSQVRERDRRSLTWFVTDSSTPADLYDRLLELGMRPSARPVHEPEYAGLVLTQPPPEPPAGVVARKLRSLEERRAALEVRVQAFGLDDAQRAGELAALERGADVGDVFGAWVDGELVAMGRAVYADAGVLLLGSGTAPHARGRGAYRGLVRARWDAAVERGTPAVVVQAGAMSRPILERLGFRRVATLRVLYDELGV